MTRNYTSDSGPSPHRGQIEPMARVDAKAPRSARRPFELTVARCRIRAAAAARHGARAGLASPTTGRAGLACFRLSATSCGPRQPQLPCAGRGSVARAGKVRRCLRLADCVRNFYRRQIQRCGQNWARSPTGWTLSEERNAPSVKVVQSFRGSRKCPRIRDFDAERFY